MHKIKQTKTGYDITLTRGDTFMAQLNLTRNGEAYTPEQGDVIRFALKHNILKADRSDYKDTNPLINKTIPNDTLTLTLVQSDTKTLAFGEYVYDIEITFEDGTVDTFIAECNFVIAPEVH